MAFDKKFYEEEFNRLLNTHAKGKRYIEESNNTFKIPKYLQKSIESIKIAHFLKTSNQQGKNNWTITISYYSMLYIAKAAILHKGYETDDHYATQIALGHLYIPSKIEQEDLELLNQAHKLFKEDYIDHFQDARKESNNSRYNPAKKYTQRRTEEIIDKAKTFINKLRTILENY